MGSHRVYLCSYTYIAKVQPIFQVGPLMTGVGMRLCCLSWITFPKLSCLVWLHWGKMHLFLLQLCQGRLGPTGRPILKGKEEREQGGGVRAGLGGEEGGGLPSGYKVNREMKK